MDIPHLDNTPKIPVSTKTFIQRLQLNWLGDQFKLYEDADYSVDSAGNYVIHSRSSLHSTNASHINCNEEQTKILKAFELLLNL